ncbi:hypothetical protein SAY86_028984 [Trapa natans]|uniref:Thioredoxin-like protein Clot n=1 Tax=Trapa natans TaxID=22666 RepID=A0AAN7MJV5_TRANT|nr:hypothetical protein SAY86_028984 [Trapa natans]
MTEKIYSPDVNSAASFPNPENSQAFGFWDPKEGRERSTGNPRMPLKLVDATVSSFDVAFEKFILDVPKHRANLILFLADKDPSTSLSWCPDCVRAEPVIYKNLEASSGKVALLRAYVGDRPTWRNPRHPWRTDPRFKLTGVPTLIRWEDDAVKGRLEDHEAHLDRKITTLVLGE